MDKKKKRYKKIFTRGAGRRERIKNKWNLKELRKVVNRASKT